MFLFRLVHSFKIYRCIYIAGWTGLVLAEKEKKIIKTDISDEKF